MIYFLAVLQLLFLLITVSSKQCHERNVIQVTGGTKESSQNGFYYGILSTPNFPQPFRTPFNQSWVIDASHHGNGTQIVIYLTQMYLSRGVKFFQRPTYDFCDQDHSFARRKRGPRQECRKPEDEHNREIFVDRLQDVLRVSTTCPYLEIEVTVPSLYGYHYRTRDPFLFFVYGFNITYEIVPERVGIKNDSCYPRNCSNLGHCYLAENWRDFYCDCIKDHRGKYCEYSSQHCDPERNITFCHNRGKCRIIGSGDGYCDCSGTGYSGALCERRNEQPQVSAKTGCTNPSECPQEEFKSGCHLEKPCSCRPNPRNGRSEVPDDWVKYEAVISISSNYTKLANQTSVGDKLQENVREWLVRNNMSVLENVIVRFHPSLEEVPPQELLIHFNGPLNVRDRVRSSLMRWLDNRKASSSQHLIPLMTETFAIYTMPRVKYKSIEVSKNSRLKIGHPVSLTCTAITGRSSYYAKNDIRFRWFKEGMPVNTSIARRHMTIGQTPPSDNETMSILLIDHVSAYDGGLYTCEITDLEFGDQECGEKVVEVTVPPQLEVEPMSLTLEKKNLELGVVITCTDGSYSAYNPNKSTTFFWYRSKSGSRIEEQQVVNGDDVAEEDIDPRGKILRIFKAEHSEYFTCRGNNKDGEERSKVLEVKVLESKNSPSCKRQLERLAKSDKGSLYWEWTAPNSVAMIPCPKNFIGYVQRPCILSRDSQSAQWGRSDFSRCVSVKLSKVNRTLQNAIRGFGDWHSVNGARLMTKLENYLSASKILYSGEGEKIIALMEDIVKYAYDTGMVTGLFPEFFRTVVKLLKMPNSCVHERTVFTLCQLMVKMAVRGAKYSTHDCKSKSAHIETSDVLMLQTLPISAEARCNLSYIFPEPSKIMDPSMSWLKDKLRVDFPLDSEALRGDTNSQMTYYLMMAAYKNLSSLLVPNDVSHEKSNGFIRSNVGNVKNIRTSTELISPVVQIFIGYHMPQHFHIKIHFNLSKEHRSLLTSHSQLPVMPTGTIPSTIKGIFFSCGVLDNSTVSTKTDDGGLRWTKNACDLAVHHQASYVECQCQTPGIYGLLKVSNIEDEIPEVNNDIPRIVIVGFSFCILSCVLSATVLCIYLKCRISLNSLYLLKLFDCFFIFSAVFIVLLGRTEMPSASWLVWSATACSFLIASLSVQVAKALRVLLMEAKPDLPGFIFPWLRNVSQMTLLSAIAFSTILPVWTATVAKIIGQSSSNDSAFDETSNVFAVFVGIVGLVVLGFLGIYYRAVLKTKAELDGCRQQQNPSSTTNSFTADMISVLTYRMKTLNRSLCLTLAILVMTLGIILNENLRHSLYIQYFLGFSATMMGMVLFLAYVTHCEFPLCINLFGQNQSEKYLRWDPEKDRQGEKSGSRRKLYAITSEITGNGSIVGTTGLLAHPHSILRNSGRHFGDEAETLSESTVEEQSMDTFSTEISFRQPPQHHTQTHKVQPLNYKRGSRSIKSVGSNTLSSSGSSYRSRGYPSTCSSERQLPVPKRAHCYITKDAGEYILPSIHRNNGPSLSSEKSNGLAVPLAEPSSADSTGSCNSYLTIHDQDALQKKTSHEFFLLRE